MSGTNLHGWILYNGSEVRELTRTCEEALAKGIKLEVVTPKDIDLVLDGCNQASVFVRGCAVPPPMFVIAAFVEEDDAYNLALLQQLETQGVLCVNRAETLKRTGDKLLTLQLLAAAGSAIPKTILIHRQISAAFIIEQLGLPVVVKVNNGSKGVGVTLVRSHNELENLLEMLNVAGVTTGVLAQEFIADSCGRDVRVLVVDGTPRVAMLRRNRSPEGFKSNISAGGSAETYPLTDEIRALSMRVIEVLGLNIGGIDLLFKEDGFVVGEANSIPGFQGIESSSDLNVPAEIFKSIARQLKERAAESSKTAAESIRSLEDLRDKGEPELVRLFIGSCHSVEKTQSNVLMDIVQRNAQTEFGRRHGFENIHSVEDFRRKVPVCEWADLEPYAKRMENCEHDLLFAGLPQHFVCTSGTTGSIKFVPESGAGDLAKSLVSRVRLALLAKMAPEIMDGFFLPLANAAAMGKTVGGIPYGSASGLTLAATSPELLRRMAFPHNIRQAMDPAAVDYLIMRFAVAKPDVRLVIGNNPGRLTILAEVADERRESLINDIEQGTISAELKLEAELRHHLEKLVSPDPERARDLRQMVAKRGRLEPRDYWQNLRIFSCWLGGTIGRYIEGLKNWLPESVEYIDCGFGASEGKFNIPMKTGVREGPLAIQGCFFEFIPLSGGEPLLAHQLVDGEDYILLITSYSGLYRYNLHDIINVTGFTGQNPNIRFISKTRDIANLAGEKLAGAFLSDLICQTLAERNIPWKHFCVVADSEMRRYNFCIEPAAVDHPDAAWLADFEAKLMESATVYQVFRNQRLLHPPRLIVMKSGWLNLLYADRTGPGVTAGQVKLPIICDTLPHSEMIEQAVEL